VTLQQFVIDEEALVTPPLSSQEDSRTQEREQRERPVRDRKQFSPGQKRGSRAQAEHESDAASGMKRRRKERVTSEAPAPIPASQPEGFPLPERSYSGKPRDGRREVGKRYRFGKTTRKHEARASAASASQYRTDRRKPRGATVAQARRASASNRSANRQIFSKKA